MAINKTYLFFKTKAGFETALNGGDIQDTSIVFIKETGQIYTHLRYFNTISDAYEQSTLADLDVAPGDTFEEAIAKLEAQIDSVDVTSQLEDYAKTEDVEIMLEDYYTQTEIDTTLGDYAKAADVYTKDEIDTTLEDYAKSDDVYTKDEVDQAIADADISDKLEDYTKTEDLAKVALSNDYADLDNVPTKVSDFENDSEFVTSAELETALGDYVKTDKLGVADGVATLGNDGKIPEAQLPSYVDDVLEVADFDSLPTEGESSKIYVTLDTNKTYRWSGSAYVLVAESLALGETAATVFAGDKGKVAYDHAVAKGAEFTEGLYKITTNGEGHVTAATAVVKLDIVDLGIPEDDTTYEVATDSADGLMSKEDKAKLDAIEEEANKYELPKASASELGGIKVGDNLSINADGVLSAANVIDDSALSTVKTYSSLKIDNIKNSIITMIGHNEDDAMSGEDTESREGFSAYLPEAVSYFKDWSSKVFPVLPGETLYFNAWFSSLSIGFLGDPLEDAEDLRPNLLITATSTGNQGDRIVVPANSRIKRCMVPTRGSGTDLVQISRQPYDYRSGNLTSVYQGYAGWDETFAVIPSKNSINGSDKSLYSVNIDLSNNGYSPSAFPEHKWKISYMEGTSHHFGWASLQNMYYEEQATPLVYESVTYTDWLNYGVWLGRQVNGDPLTTPPTEPDSKLINVKALPGILLLYKHKTLSYFIGFDTMTNKQIQIKLIYGSGDTDFINLGTVTNYGDLVNGKNDNSADGWNFFGKTLIKSFKNQHIIISDKADGTVYLNIDVNELNALLTADLINLKNNTGVDTDMELNIGNFELITGVSWKEGVKGYMMLSIMTYKSSKELSSGSISEETLWTDKTWFSYGTSMTQGYGGAGYVSNLATLSGMKNTNFGIGGGGIIPSLGHHGNVKNTICTLNDGKDKADLITIEVIPNDMSGTLGTTTDTSDATFCGNLNLCIQYLQENTNAQIVVLVLTRSRYALDAGHTGYTPTCTNVTTWLLWEAAVKEICARNCVYFINVAESCGLGYHRVKANNKYVQDQIHLTYAGAQNAASMIWNRLKLIPNFYIG